ncbi:ABC transporter ATP-binding protein [Candidatus Sulfidibacterium hydrothermale]|uniref:ABC transporter ATP-binding protein n=1 Tax=Candidatus Sulfidibacterium hydrothermale TaxID=2875962 RepID=UPI001F0A91B9|nr:ABC transporter ATP-binding protein [Candidatus Sulfidibacterium hydrothermale]UBM63355.1 ABC transporter ATP-binding protein [Candidatus Sulfidibacterium hydrothermale]
MSIIETKGIYKTYEETKVPVKALNGVDLKIEEGEFTAIVGPSGSGKTTLLNILGGLDLPSQGDIFIDGTNLKSLTSRQLIDFRLYNTGFVFQAYNLIPVLTARENTEFILELQKVPKKVRRQKAMELLEAVGIADKADHKPGQLSGGQQQRVAVARALASQPRFIIADEPTANLDSRSTNELLEIMAEMNRKYKTTFVFATHDQRVMDKARRIVTLDDGKIISDETFKRK